MGQQETEVVPGGPSNFSGTWSPFSTDEEVTLKRVTFVDWMDSLEFRPPRQSEPLVLWWTFSV